MLRYPRLVSVALPLFAVFAMGLSLAVPVQAQPEGVSYTFTPTYNIVQWGDEVGLEDTELYGGRLGISFGRMAALQGYYLTREDVKTRLSGIEIPVVSAAPGDRELDVNAYGLDVMLSLGAGRVVPFLRAGGGILEFNPAVGDDIRQINMKAGGGLRFGFRHFQAEVFAEDSAFRVDRFQLAAPSTGDPYPADPDGDEIRHNLSMGAGLTFFLGGSSESRLSETDRAVLERYRHGLSGLSIPIEPFVGRLDFHDDLMLDEQYLVGLRTGLDFGRFFGLRGYYWRAVNDDFDDTVPLQSYGGEARFNLNSGQGAVPYLVTGVGHLDFMDDFAEEVGPALDDKTMLILGGGLGFRLNDRLELDLSVRDHILSAKDLDDTSDPDDLLANWMFGGSIRFSLGGSSPQGQKPLFGKAEEPARKPAPPREALEPEALEAELEALEGEEESEELQAEDVAEDIEMDEEDDFEPGDAPPMRGEKRRIEKVIRHGKPAHGYAGERVVVLPVPTEGEIYIRYGSPGGVSIESRSVVGESVAPQAPVVPPPPGPPAVAPAPPAETQVPDLEMIREVIRDELRRAGVVRERGEGDKDILVVEKEPSEPRRIVIQEAGAEVEEEERGEGLKPVGLRALTGFSLDDPNQFVLDGRLDLGPVKRGSKFHLIPELALGFGDDATTFLGAANLQFPFGNLGGSHQWSPYAYAGMGLLSVDVDDESDTDLTVNFGLGMDARFGRWAPFVEYQGIRGFDLNRILLGLRFGH